MELNHLESDHLWVGLGTPKQQLWIDRYRDRLKAGLLLGAGFTFDQHPELKLDVPMWMQRRCLPWILRMWIELRRLDPRHNSRSCHRIDPGQ